MELGMLSYCIVTLVTWYQWYQVHVVPNHTVLVCMSGTFPGPRRESFSYVLSHTELRRELEVTVRGVVVS